MFHPCSIHVPSMCDPSSIRQTQTQSAGASPTSLHLLDTRTTALRSCGGSRWNTVSSTSAGRVLAGTLVLCFTAAINRTSSSAVFMISFNCCNLFSSSSLLCCILFSSSSHLCCILFSSSPLLCCILFSSLSHLCCILFSSSSHLCCILFSSSPLLCCILFSSLSHLCCILFS